MIWIIFFLRLENTGNFQERLFRSHTGIGYDVSGENHEIDEMKSRFI
jgi:hypothetical protein